MPIYFHRLENALKRANEFIDVGKKPRALEILCDVLRSRKHRTWQKKHEDIMMKYLELCVELKKSYVAKEGIYQYKIICQQTYINSFELVVRKYIEMAEEKANAAKEQSHISHLDVDDLDNAQTPEDILLSAVSNEDTQDRTDRVVLIPWVKFLWESYRQCLDLLKNNSRTERLYHDIAHQAFKFCIKYNRKTEFRKLCDNLHAHLDILKKQQQNQQQNTHQQQNTVNLSNPESQSMHLETRLVQLDSAIQMELWQEAYKATDDIKRFGLMNLSKKQPKPQLLANYYQKLSLVFLKAHCPLFHSAALFRLFHLSKELRKNITAEDVQKMASKVVAATLAIPIPPNRPEIDKIVDTEENIIENNMRNLSSLLGLTTNIPNRASLIKDLKRLGVLQHAYQPLQDLYKWLEIDFHPLVLCGRVQQVIEFIGKCNECPELNQYVTPLKDVTIMRLLKEVSQVYQTIEFKRLLELCPFTNYTNLEKVVVQAARRNDLQVRIDHRKGCLIFGTELRVSQGEVFIEGPHLQSMPSEQIRRQLMNMYSVLQKARVLIEPDIIKAQHSDLKRQIMQKYRQTANDEHKRILHRRELIEERKEQLERQGLMREEEERKIMEEKQQRLREAEEERLMKETEEREKQIKQKKELAFKKQMAIDQISMIKGSVASHLIENMDDEELARLRPEDIQSRKIEQLEKGRREMLAKQRKLERKVDHLERAKRYEEIPLLQKAYEEWRVKDENEWTIMEDERIKDIKEQRALALQHSERFTRMQSEVELFATMIKDQRAAVYNGEMETFKKIFDSEKAKRLEKRKAERKEERRKKWIKDKEDEKKRIETEAKMRVKAEHEAELARIEEKKRMKEREIEEKMMKQKDFIIDDRGKDEDRFKRDERPNQFKDENDIGIKRNERANERTERNERTRSAIDDSWRRKEETSDNKDGDKDNWRNKAPIETPAESEKSAPAPWRPRPRVAARDDKDNEKDMIIRKPEVREDVRDAPRDRAFDTERDRDKDRDRFREREPFERTRNDGGGSWRDNDKRDKRDDNRRDDFKRDERRDDFKRDERRDDFKRDERRDDYKRDDRRDDFKREERRDDNRRFGDNESNWRERTRGNDNEDDGRRETRRPIGSDDYNRDRRPNYAKDDRGSRINRPDDRNRDRDTRRPPPQSRADDAQDWRRADDKRNEERGRTGDERDQRGKDDRDRINPKHAPPKRGFGERRGDRDGGTEDDGWTTVRSRR